MHVVIFELEPKAGCHDDYLEIAADLRKELDKIDGFISVERFSSLTTEGKLVSISFWRDAEAVAAWRQEQHHRKAQHSGRSELFADYRLTVAEVARQYGLHDRDQAPS
ncbi:antibiotic biosynthesis monooxygenase family protein [Denitrobaculum tricleocarpae]|uniref:Antibiotic biosynthesis monooxygenase n=1 Tax=Denitrobaculum tricleocarpae TaxID=2591009 RepID=A0A545TKH9_9PROT|nr:antibiotic biosynthesis monooxygenase [Denitrobaculum tricleocarpae]TQV77733.1 antibiotic biosynthesis monooxygenase [Denitrobaculum tricleocarpae]